MTWLDAIILGIIQGLTEFLPISSSGHLVLTQYFMDIHERGMLLEVVLHIGTLTSILIYYWNDILKLSKDIFNGVVESRAYIFYLGVATVPAIFSGLLLDKFIVSAFIPSIVSVMLFINGLILATTYFSLNQPVRQFSLLTALCIGIAQACALIPGISRSGITISIALIMGIRRQDSAKFAFFMAIPVLLGAGLFEIVKIDNIKHIDLFPLIMGFFSASIVGYLVIDWLLAVISKGKFYLFSLYCFTISIIAYILIN